MLYALSSGWRGRPVCLQQVGNAPFEIEREPHRWPAFGKQQKPVLQGIEVWIAGYLDIPLAIPLHQIESTLADPLKRLQTIRRFPCAKGRFGEMVQAQPITEMAVDLLEEVDARQLTEIGIGVGGEDPVVKPLVVETHHQ